jgi:hypothetical protein
MTITGSNCYVLIAIDDDYRVRECIVVTSLLLATELHDKLKGIWGGEKVCLAARAIDAVPDNLELSAMTAPSFRGEPSLTWPASAVNTNRGTATEGRGEG